MTSIFTKLKTNLKHALVPLSLCLLLGGISGTSYASIAFKTFEYDVKQTKPYSAEWGTRTLTADDFYRIGDVANALRVLTIYAKQTLEMTREELCAAMGDCDATDPFSDPISIAASNLASGAYHYYNEMHNNPGQYINYGEQLRRQHFDPLAEKMHKLHNLMYSKGPDHKFIVPFCKLVTNTFEILQAIIIDFPIEAFSIGGRGGDD